jgi:hypothetical protein
MDSIILSRIPSEIWQKVERATVEIWATDEVVEADVQILLEFWQKFRRVSCDSGMQKAVGLQELRNFWLGKSGEFRDLYLIKN